MATDEIICLSVVDFAIKKGLVSNPRQKAGSYYLNVKSESKEKIMSIVWEYVNQGILYLHNPSHNTYNITEYGLQVLKAEKPIPHDPEGYLAHLKKEIPDIDGVILTYMTEAITAYNHRLYLSATTAIGCASEKAILLLIEAYRGFVPSEKEKTKFSDMSNKTVKRQFEEFQKSFNGVKGNIKDKDLNDGLDGILDGVYDTLRLNRNATGHPTGKTMVREDVFASLQVFITYCKRIYGLIHYFEANPNTSDT
ncbi:MAG: hypothetical protein LIO49_00280 [Ruminococcus sp.]|nr:hypothetical protein [Ruminococcus sp.]